MITGRDAERLASIGRSSGRITAARQRRGGQKRWLGLFVVLLALCCGAFYFIQQSAPPPPALIVRWPKPKLDQVVSSGSTLLARRGSSFEVALSDNTHWSAHWTDPNAEGPAKVYLWKINGQQSTVSVKCRVVADGWMRLIAWAWPTYELKLNAVAGTSLGGFRYKIVPPKGGLWLYPYIYAKAPVTWDEQALQLLSEPLVPILKGTLIAAVPIATPQPAAETSRNSRAKTTSTDMDIAVETPAPSQPMWWIVPSFDEKPQNQPNTADTGTYAKLNSQKLESDTLNLSRLLSERRPQASLKFIVRLDSKSPYSVLRIAFDGKGARQGWIRRSGEASGGPVLWPESDFGTGNSALSPSLPSSSRRRR